MRDDARAVANALAGRREGYRALFERHRAAVERAVAGFAELDEGEAQEIVLESFARAFGRLGLLKEPARFGAWVLATAHQRCQSRLARKRDADAILADLAAAPQIELVSDPCGGPLDVNALLSALPEGPEREAPRLFYVEGRLTARQIAERLKLEPDRVTLHLEGLRARAKAALAACLLARRAGGEEGPVRPHLDPTTWKAVLRGERFPGERALAAHLAGGCRACERFLASLRDADGLDGDVDAALVGSANAARPAHADAAFELAMRRLHLYQRVSGASPAGAARPTPSNILPMALAAALALGGLAVYALQRAPRQEHRRGLTPAVELAASVVPVGLPRDRGEPGVPGTAYPEDRVVFLRYQLAAPAFVTLVRIAPDGSPEVLAQQGRVGPGVHDLLVNGMPAAVSLRGAPGTHRFLAVASVAPVAPEALLGIFAAFPESGEAAPALEGAGVARLDLEISGSEAR